VRFLEIGGNDWSSLPPFLSLKVLQDKKKKTRIEPDIPPFPFSFWKDVT
jgi:hypothetical protein